MTKIITSETFSNIGVWGLDGTPLSIDCDASLTEVRVFLETPAKQFLNIRYVELLDENGTDLIHSELLDSAVVSSNFYSDKDKTNHVEQRLKSKSLIHSRFEVKPTLTIKFRQNVFIKCIKIGNRADECGLRSKSIAVEGYKGEKCAFVFQNLSQQSIEDLTKELLELLVKYHRKIVVPINAVAAAAAIRRVVFELQLEGHNVSEKLLESLLPTSKRAPSLDSFSALYLSNRIENRLAIKSHKPTKELQKYNFLLTDDATIEALAAFSSNHISTKQKRSRDIVIAKHRTHYNTLLEHKENHLDLLDKLFKSLEKVKATPMVCYGTLLGAYRNGCFLPADDDLDILLYYPNTADELEREKTKQQLLDFVLAQGFSANTQPRCPHITVNSATAGVSIDIFLAWTSAQKDQASVVMENLQFRDIAAATLVPTSKIQLHGRTYPAPASIEGFLQARYGDGWQRSNPYHEWAWNLKRRVFFDDQSISHAYDKREQQRRFRCRSTRTQFVAWSQCVLKKDRPPSNSIPMLEQALQQNYDVIELDIRTTKDRKVVVAHDDILKNKAGDSIVLSQSTLKQATGFQLGEYHGQKVFLPALSEALPLLYGKQILLDARFKPDDYKVLRECVDECGIDPKLIIFCVYNEPQLTPLMQYFPESLLFWKFYTQAWEIDPLSLYQLRRYGVDGIMYMYPHFDEDISESLYQIKKFDLQSMCFIHGEAWTPENSSGLSPKREERTKDNYELSLQRMVASGIEYVTTTECESNCFNEVVKEDL